MYFSLAFLLKYVTMYLDNISALALLETTKGVDLN